MIEFFSITVVLTTPLFIGGVLYSIAVATNVFSSLNIPLQEAWFGPEKSWRGVIIMPICTLIGIFPVRTSAVFEGRGWMFLGLALGVCCILSELPNAFLKRLMGARADHLPKGRVQILSLLMDRADFALGCGLAYDLFLDLSDWTVYGAVLLGAVVHLAAKHGLYRAGLRKDVF